MLCRRAIEQYCKVEGGYSGVLDVNEVRSVSSPGAGGDWKVDAHHLHASSALYLHACMVLCADRTVHLPRCLPSESVHLQACLPIFLDATTNHFN